MLAGSSRINNSGGTLQIGNGGTSGSYTGANIINNASLVFDLGSAYTVNNAISGTGTLSQNRSATLTLSGANTYGGATIVNAGTLALVRSLNLGSATAMTMVAAGATLNGGGVITAGTLLDSGPGTVNLTVSGVGGGAGSGGNDYGISVTGTGSTIATTGSGALTLTGVGGNALGSGGSNHGVYADATHGIATTGTGSITINGTASSQTSSYGIYEDVNGSFAPGPSNPLTLIGDTMNFAGTMAGSCALTIAPLNAATSIGLGDGQSGTLNLGAAQLANIQPGFASITIGSPTGTGAISVGTWTANAPLTIEDAGPGGIITLNGALATGSGASAGSILLAAGTSISGNSGGSIATVGQPIALIADVANSGSGSIGLTGDTLNSHGGALTLSAPNAGNATAISLAGNTISVGSGTISGTSTSGAGIYFDPTNTITSSSGQLSATGSSTAGSGVILASGAVVNTSGAVTIAGMSGSGSGVVFQGSNSLSSAGGALAVNGSSASGIGSQISGAVSFNNGASGSFAINGASGGNADGLQLASGGALATSGPITLTGSSSAIGVNVAGTVQNGGGSLGLIAAIGSLVTQPTGALNASGTGTYSLTGSSIIIGAPISTAGGDVTVTGPTTLGANVTTNNGTLTFNSPVALTANIATNSGTGMTSFGATVDGDYSLAASAGTFSFAGALGGQTALGAVSLTSASTLTLPSVTGASLVAQTTGAVADLILGPGSTLNASGPNTAVTLVAGRNFINDAGAGTIALSGSGARWLIYSADPSGDSFENLNSNDTAIWDATYAVNPPSSINATGDRYVFASQPALMFTSTSTTKVYGTDATSIVAASYTASGADPGVTGAYLADSISSLFSGAPSVTSAGSAASATVTGGPYSNIVAQGSLASVNGYSFTFVSTGQLAVTQANLTVTASNQSKTYGTALDLGSTAFTDTGLVNGDALSSVTLTSPGTVATATVAGGPYAIKPSNAVGTGLSTYTISYANGALAVNPATLTVTASNQSKTYGTTLDLGSTAFTDTGLVNGDALGSVTLTSPGAVATATVAGGPYAIKPSNAVGSSLSNYVVSYANGALTVNPATLTGVITAASTVYDGKTTATLTSEALSGTIYNADAGNLQLMVGAANFNSKDVLTANNVTATDMTLSGTAALNYRLTSSSASASASIIPRPLTISANPASQIYGNSTPTLAYLLGGLGLVSGDQLTGALSTSATPASHVGAYWISPGTLTASPNYTVTYVGNTLTIDPRPLTVTANPESQLFAYSTPPLTYVIGALGLVDGDHLTGALSTLPNANATVGTYAIAQGTLAASSDYVLSYVGATLMVFSPGWPMSAELAARSYLDALKVSGASSNVDDTAGTAYLDRSATCMEAAARAAQTGVPVPAPGLHVQERCARAWTRAGESINWWALATGRTAMAMASIENKPARRRVTSAARASDLPEPTISR